MRPLMLDYRRTAPPEAMAWVLFGAGAMLAVAVMMMFASVNRELPVWEAQAAKANQGVRRNITMRDSEVSRRELKQANLVLQRLTLPWEGLFAALETSRSEKVALLAVEPDVAKGLLHIDAETKRAADMLNYLRRLERDAALSEVVLLRHQIQLQDADRPLRFSVRAAWGSKP